jgi:hypothetical protein
MLPHLVAAIRFVEVGCTEGTQPHHTLHTQSTHEEDTLDLLVSEIGESTVGGGGGERERELQTLGGLGLRVAILLLLLRVSILLLLLLWISLGCAWMLLLLLWISLGCAWIRSGLLLLVRCSSGDDSVCMRASVGDNSTQFKQALWTEGD